MRKDDEVKAKGECNMQSQDKKVEKLLEAKMNLKKTSVDEKFNEQVLREIKCEVWKVVEQMSEEPKFLEAGFNLTNYEAFVKQAMELKEQLRGEGVILVSEECSAILKQEVVVPEI